MAALVYLSVHLLFAADSAEFDGISRTGLSEGQWEIVGDFISQLSGAGSVAQVAGELSLLEGPPCRLDELRRCLAGMGVRCRVLDLERRKKPYLPMPAMLVLTDGSLVLVAGERESEYYVLDSHGQGNWVDSGNLFAKALSPVLFLECPRATGAPRLWTPTAKVDIGSLDGDSREVRSLAILNLGGADLELSKPAFTCGCARVVSFPTSLAPGGAAAIQLSIDASKKRDGLFSVGMFLRTNEQSEALRRFDLVGSVQRGIKVTPTFHDVGRVYRTDNAISLISTIDFGKAYTGGIHPPGTTGNEPLECVSVSPLNEGRYQVKFLFIPGKCDPGWLGKRFHLAMDMHCHHEKFKRIRIRVVGTLAAPIETYPSEILIAPVVEHGTAEAALIVVNNTSSPVNADTPPNVTLTWRDREKSRATVGVVLPDDTDFLHTYLTLSAEGQSVQIPVTALRRESAIH